MGSTGPQCPTCVVPHECKEAARVASQERSVRITAEERSLGSAPASGFPPAGYNRLGLEVGEYLDSGGQLGGIRPPAGEAPHGRR